MKSFWLFFSLILISFVSAFAQKKDLTNVPAYWGAITELKVSADELLSFESIIVQDTIKNRNIKWVSGFQFYMQPALNGPLKVANSSDKYLNSQMRQFIANPQPGDRIVVSEIIGYVENEGIRQIPTAIVLVVQ